MNVVASGASMFDRFCGLVFCSRSCRIFLPSVVCLQVQRACDRSPCVDAQFLHRLLSGCIVSIRFTLACILPVAR